MFVMFVVLLRGSCSVSFRCFKCFLEGLRGVDQLVAVSTEV